eukprot:scaffold268788_cov31-Tisochrysis_lutea.AAC.4
MAAGGSHSVSSTVLRRWVQVNVCERETRDERAVRSLQAKAELHRMHRDGGLVTGGMSRYGIEERASHQEKALVLAKLAGRY